MAYVLTRMAIDRAKNFKCWIKNHQHQRRQKKKKKNFFNSFAHTVSRSMWTLWHMMSKLMAQLTTNPTKLHKWLHINCVVSFRIVFEFILQQKCDKRKRAQAKRQRQMHENQWYFETIHGFIECWLCHFRFRDEHNWIFHTCTSTDTHNGIPEMGKHGKCEDKGMNQRQLLGHFNEIKCKLIADVWHSFEMSHLRLHNFIWKINEREKWTDSQMNERKEKRSKKNFIAFSLLFLCACCSLAFALKWNGKVLGTAENNKIKLRSITFSKRHQIHGSVLID